MKRKRKHKGRPNPFTEEEWRMLLDLQEQVPEVLSLPDDVLRELLTMREDLMILRGNEEFFKDLRRRTEEGDKS